MNKFILAIALLSGCTAPERSTVALQKAGYSDIQTTGHSWFECGKDDKFSTGFKARNPVGVGVSGTVCCGWFKSCTIRF